MSVSAAPGLKVPVASRVGRTVALLDRRGYALPPGPLGSLCLGGPVPELAVREAVTRDPELELRDGLVVRSGNQRSGEIAERSRVHPEAAALYLPRAIGFVRTLTTLNPYILGVSIAGSLASGGFKDSDDVDLNLVVEDGRRHLAYVALNALGLAHALRFRGKPVDAHTARPLAPRLMTANLVLERAQCFPLARLDEDMAFELLASQPVHGVGFWRDLVAANPGLLAHFPQLACRTAPWAAEAPARLPLWLFPRALDGPSRRLGSAAWRFMQWTRRDRPEALRRVAYVRATMRPYALFEDPG